MVKGRLSILQWIRILNKLENSIEKIEFILASIYLVEA